MEILTTYPPNYDVITAAIPTVAGDKNAIFCYGNRIYNPHGKEIPPDLQVHEAVHARQQGNDPDGWWARYLSEPQFRLAQEIEAYGTQFAFAKKGIEAAAEEASKQGKVLVAGKNNLIRFALESMAFALSGETYGRLISYGEAETKIKNYGKFSG